MIVSLGECGLNVMFQFPGGRGGEMLCLKTFRIVSCWTLLCYALQVIGYGAFKAYGSD